MGVELVGALVERARRAAAAVGVEAEFVHDDAFNRPDLVREADAVGLFLTTAGLRLLAPWLKEHLSPGAAVVSNTWEVPGWTPVEVLVDVDGRGRPFALYLYRPVPAEFDPLVE